MFASFFNAWQGTSTRQPAPVGDLDSPVMTSGSSAPSSSLSSGPPSLSSPTFGGLQSRPFRSVEAQRMWHAEREKAVAPTMVLDVQKPRTGRMPAPAMPLPAEPSYPSLLNNQSGLGERQLGPHEKLSTLSDEFPYNAHFGEKVRHLRELGYVGWRRVRGDGNCFYRAVGFGMLEQIENASSSQRQHWAAHLHGKFVGIEFKAAAHAAAHAELVARIARLARGGSWEDRNSAGGGPTDHMGALFLSLRDPDKPMDYALIRAIRHLAAEYLWKHATDEEAGGGISYDVICRAQEFAGIEDYVKQMVLPMGKEVEGIGIGAVARSLQIGLRIAYVDRDASPVTFNDEGWEETAAGRPSCRPQIHLQLRPGHYDMLYFAADSPTPTMGSTRLPARGPAGPTIYSATLAPITTSPNPTLQSASSPASMRSQRPPTFGDEDGNAWLLSDPPEVATLLPNLAFGGRFIAERQAIEKEAFGASKAAAAKPSSPTYSLGGSGVVTLGKRSSTTIFRNL